MMSKQTSATTRQAPLTNVAMRALPPTLVRTIARLSIRTGIEPQRDTTSPQLASQPSHGNGRSHPRVDSDMATPSGTPVHFTLERTLPISSEAAWDELTNWAGHAEWIPMTRVKVDPGDPTAFVAFSGPGPLALEDRMRAIESQFDGASGRCLVSKLGPVLVGEAEFTVVPGTSTTSCVVSWREDVTVPHLPRFLAPVAARIGVALFGWSLKRMARHHIRSV